MNNSTNVITSNDKENDTVIEEIRKQFSHDKQTLDDLEAFLQAKAVFIQEENIENRLLMKMAYVNIYEDIKMGWVGRRYAENTFRRYEAALKSFPQ